MLSTNFTKAFFTGILQGSENVSEVLLSFEIFFKCFSKLSFWLILEPAKNISFINFSSILPNISTFKSFSFLVAVVLT